MWTKKSFTLIEMILVVVIIGVISVVGLFVYSTIIRKSVDREGKAILSLVQVAQRNYRMEHYPYFYPCPATTSESGIANINTNLRLSIPTDSQWAITLDCSGSGFATATRLGRTWKILLPAGSDEIPTCTAGC